MKSFFAIIIVLAVLIIFGVSGAFYVAGSWLASGDAGKDIGHFIGDVRDGIEDVAKEIKD